MENTKEYQELIKTVSKHLLPFDTIRSFLDNDLVASVVPKPSDDIYPNKRKYQITLVNDDIHYVYVK